MGMFDYIRIASCQLPITEAEQIDIELEDSDFQTKDLACTLNCYEITPYGELILIQRMVEDWQYKEVYEQVSYHGCLNFYTDVFGKWFEFQAKFTDGKMVEIKRLPLPL